MNGAWRIYHTWRKAEPVRQAPPLSKGLLHAMTGAMTAAGERRTAIMCLTVHHCILRLAEMFELRESDCAIVGNLSLFIHYR